MEQNENFKGFFKGILILLICIGTIFYRAESNADIAGKSIAFIIGYSLVPAGVFYLLLVVIFKASGSKLVEVATFGALLLGVSVGNYIGMNAPKGGSTDASAAAVQESSGAVALNEVGKTYQEYYDSAVDENGNPRVSDINMDTTPKAGGEAGIMEGLLKEYIKSLQQLQNDYLKDLQAMGWNNVLDPQRVSDPSSYAQSAVIISRARLRVDEYEIDYQALMNAFPDKVRESGLSQQSKEAFIVSFAGSKLRSDFTRDEIFRLEREIVNAAAAAIDSLENSRGRWYVENNQVVFQADQDLESYNANVIAIQNLTEQQKTLREGLNREAMGIFEEAAK